MSMPNALFEGPQRFEEHLLFRGKVRDIYRAKESGQRVLLTTDRVSAFDSVVGTIPGRGRVLNELAAWWFAQLEDILPHHVVDTPHPNLLIARAADPLPVEVIVRGYITGSTSTSLWTLYDQGVERPYGLSLPAGLKKNDKLPKPVITPTTKAGPGEHDERLTCDEVVSRGLVSEELWRTVCEKALALFARGQELAAKAGLILVDTKYELGIIDGQLALIDEVHTPDSSRYWTAESYEKALADGRAPEHADKEILRLYLREAGITEAPESLPDDVVERVASRYGEIFEALTNRQPSSSSDGLADAMTDWVEED